MTAARAQCEWSFSGYAEIRGHHFRSEGRSLYLAHQYVRPDVRARLNERLVLSSTVEAGLRQQRAFQPMEVGGPELVRESGSYLELERLFADVYLHAADFRIGRQAVTWGSAFLVNPTDPFPEVLLVEPWRARSGVNAARATVRLGDLHQVHSVLGMDDDFQHLLAAARSTFRAGAADLSLSGVWKEETRDGLVGVDLRGNLGIGYWVEGALHLGGGEACEEVAAGVDYSFPVLDNLVLTAQYYRHGNPNADVRPGALTAHDRDNGILSLALNINPEYTLSTLWIQSLHNRNGLVVPVVTVTPGNRFEISAAAHIRLRDASPCAETAVSETQILRQTFVLWAQLNF